MRTININGKIYKWQVGHGFVRVVRKEDKFSLNVEKEKVGELVYYCERVNETYRSEQEAIANCCNCGTTARKITPKHIRELILAK